MASANLPRRPDRPPEPVPPLEPGDRLTRDEFERRYNAMPGLKKAELIEGIVYVPSRVRLRGHGSPRSRMAGWLGVYAAGTPGVIAADNTSIHPGLDNEPRPEKPPTSKPAGGAG